MDNYMNRLYNCSSILKEDLIDVGCVYTSRQLNMSIYIHSRESDDLYLKIFNGYSLESSTKCCRIKIFKAKYKKRPDDDYLCDYKLDAKEKQNIINILNGNSSSLFGHLYDHTLWEQIIIDLLRYNRSNKKIKKLLLKAMHNIPDYTRL